MHAKKNILQFFCNILHENLHEQLFLHCVFTLENCKDRKLNIGKFFLFFFFSRDDNLVNKIDFIDDESLGVTYSTQIIKV